MHLLKQSIQNILLIELNNDIFFKFCRHASPMTLYEFHCCFITNITKKLIYLVCKNDSISCRHK